MNEEVKENNVAINMPIPVLERSDNPILDSGSEKTEHSWSIDIEKQLEAIEINAAQQAAISKEEYLNLMYIQKFYKLPVIVLSGINSVFAVGLNSYANQSVVSIINCLLAFICATIGSIELYLNISKKIEISLASFQSFYLLSIKINNCLRLERDHRSEFDGRKYLSDCLNEYESIFSTNYVSPANIHDKLTSIEMIKI